jgi:hypothetical protein
MPKQNSTEYSGNWPALINTGLQAGAHEAWFRNSRFNGLSKQRSRGKPLKRLKLVCQAMSTGLKPGVNESEDSINPPNKSRSPPDSALL